MEVSYSNHGLHQVTITIDDDKHDAYSNYIEKFNEVVKLIAEKEGKKLSLSSVCYIRMHLDVMFEAGMKGFKNG